MMVQRTRLKTISMLLGTTVLAMTSSTAFAQGPSAAAPADSADAENGLGEIVVTAEKKPITLQSAPLTVTAVTADKLREQNVTDITGLNGTVPGLLVARSGGGERMITIRGIGSETPENTNTQPGVSYHVDGVYIFNSIAASAAFIDVAQVEVLRGPQGTMFGQGSTGGTINVVTAQPTTEKFTGSANLGAGNYDLLKGDAALNVPLGETFAVRGAFQYYKHDGYAHATGVPGYDKYELDNADETGWKLSALWKPSDIFSLTLSTIQYHSDTHGPAQKNILDPEPDARILSQDFPGRSVIDTQLYYATAKLDLGGVTATSITSYQKLLSKQAWDSDGLTADLFYAQTYNPISFTGVRYDHVPLWQANTKSWTQEVNLASSDSGPFQWILGGVYLHSKNAQYINEYRSDDFEILRPALPRDAAFNDPSVPDLTYAELSEIKREAWAAYFQGTYDITDKFSVIAGIRYNHDKYSGMSSTNSDEFTSGAYLQPSPTDGLKTTEWTGKFALQYKLTPSNMVYASYTRGFKPGGINGAASGGNSYSIMSTYQPETVDSFEVGSKNRFFNDTLQFNASGFYYNYTNMQFLEEDPILYGEGISNAPSAHIYGLELESAWLLDSHWSVEGSASFLRGKFDKDYFALDPVNAAAAQNAAGYPDYLFWTNFFPAVLARDGARQNINGNQVPKLPKVTLSGSLAYTNQVGPGQLTGKVQGIYRGKYNYRLFNDAGTDITRSYTQVNLFVSYVPDDTNFSISVSVTNLFNKNGLNSRFSDPYGSSQTMDTFIPPRQAIFSVGYKF